MNKNICESSPNEKIKPYHDCPEKAGIREESYRSTHIFVHGSTLKTLYNLSLLSRQESQTYGKVSHIFLFTVALTRPGIICYY